jgi:hypothetical protein
VEQAGARVEPSLVQRLLNDTNEELDRLPVLQHVTNLPRIYLTGQAA